MIQISTQTPEEIHNKLMEEKANAIKHMVIGCLIAEYGLLLLGAQTHELKSRINTALRACRSVQECLIHHPNALPHHRELFKREFLKSSYVLISELLVSVWQLSEEDLEEIIQQIKANTDDPEKMQEMPDNEG